MSVAVCSEWPQGDDPNEIIYENVRIRSGGGTLESTDQYGGWSSSEFESCDELEEETTSQTSRDRRSRSPSDSQVGQACRPDSWVTLLTTC